MDKLLAARSQFPVTEHAIYLDLANQSAPPRAVTEELERYHRRASLHGPDKGANLARLEDVRRQAAALLHCRPEELAWTKNTSEGLNIAAAGIDFEPGDNVVLSQFEHPNNTYVWLGLAARGVEVRVIRPPGDVATAADFMAAMDERTRAVACSAVSYMPGERLDLAALSAACRRQGAYLVVDAVQAIGLVDLDVGGLGLDMLATSGHKGLLTPHGVGLFFCRRDICRAIRPAFVARSSMSQLTAMEHDAREYAYALHEDARRFEYGNYNYSGISAMGAALDLLADVGLPTIERHITGLADQLIAGLTALAGRGVRVLTPRPAAERASIVGFGCPDTERVAAALRRAGVVFTVRRDAIRLGLGLYNTAAEVELVLEVIGANLP